MSSNVTPSVSLFDSTLYEKIYEIRKAKLRGVSEDELKQRYNDVETKYPTLFSCAIQQTFDLEILRYMIQRLEQIDKNNVTQNTASEEVGTMLFQKYVQPHVSSEASKTG